MTAEERLEQLKEAGNKRVKKYRETKKGINFHLDKKLVEKFDKKLKKDGITKTGFFKKCVEDYLKEK